MDEDEMLEGYMDGLGSDLDELPQGTNRSPGYMHGWRNGRDDRKGKPRAAAAELRSEAEEIRKARESWL
jgi:hypothetical protein